MLSNGHGSMLVYSLLLPLTGYDLPIEELQNFRQLHSKTPGHPEYGYTPGVETTTGPLGQGLANAVGMAIAERTLGAQFNLSVFPRSSITILMYLPVMAVLWKGFPMRFVLLPGLWGWGN